MRTNQFVQTAGNLSARLGFAAVLLAVSGWTVVAKADLASTSFENESIFAGVKYIDTGNAGVDHDLVNNAGQPVVDSTSGSSNAGDLSFNSFYFNTRGSVGLTDGDFVGVTNFTGDVGSFTRGSQGFQISDTDGLMQTVFGDVDISGGPAKLTLDLFVNETGWELTDRIRVYVDVDGNEFDLLNTDGSDIDNLGIEDSWFELSEDLSGSTAKLIVELDSNAGAEAIYLDNVRFVAVAVPEPSSVVALVALTAGVAGVRLRRRFRRSKQHA